MIEDLLKKRLFLVRPCGLNADWCVRAWHLGPSDLVNHCNGDYYLLDNEDGKFFLVRQWESDSIKDTTELVCSGSPEECLDRAVDLICRPEIIQSKGSV